MSKETIIGATPEQVNKNTSGRLYTVSQNATGGIDCNMYCFIKDIEQKDKKIADLEAKLAESEEQIWALENQKLHAHNCLNKLKQQLAEWQDGTIICKWTDAENKIKELEHQLAEKDKLIQEYEKIVEQQDEEISFANRDKTYIVKQLNDPKDYVLLEDYKKVEQQLAEKEKEIDELNRFIEKLMFYIGEHCDVCEQPFCTQGSPRLPNSPLIIFGTFEGCPENCHICIEQYIKEDYEIFEKEFDNMQKELDEKEEEKNKMICHIGYDNLKYLMANNDWQILEAHQVKEYNQLRKANQDKISFCIEKLVNIQKYISDNAVFVEEECFGREINEYIDYQIASLKKGVE